MKTGTQVWEKATEKKKKKRKTQKIRKRWYLKSEHFGHLWILISTTEICICPVCPNSM